MSVKGFIIKQNNIGKSVQLIIFARLSKKVRDYGCMGMENHILGETW